MDNYVCTAFNHRDIHTSLSSAWVTFDIRSSSLLDCPNRYTHTHTPDWRRNDKELLFASIKISHAVVHAYLEKKREKKTRSKEKRMKRCVHICLRTISRIHIHAYLYRSPFDDTSIDRCKRWVNVSWAKGVSRFEENWTKRKYHHFSETIGEQQLVRLLSESIIIFYWLSLVMWYYAYQ